MSKAVTIVGDFIDPLLVQDEDGTRYTLHGLTPAAMALCLKEEESDSDPILKVEIKFSSLEVEVPPKGPRLENYPTNPKDWAEELKKNPEFWGAILHQVISTKGVG
jgi:hypothetical protein